MLKKLAGQTAIYGLSSILGRILNYLLVPLYTRVFIPSEFGTVTEMYAYVAFLVVILTYGMETAFFRYMNLKNESSGKSEIYSTSLISLLVTSGLFALLVVIFSQNIANVIEYPDNKEYLIYFAFILAIDAITSLPFARLRAENKALKFAALKLAFIFISVGLNIFFLIICPYIEKNKIPLLYGLIQPFFNGINVGYVFVSNLIANIFLLIFLFPEIFKIKFKFDYHIWKKMIFYGLPLLIAGLAGITNETMDRVLLKYLLPEGTAMHQLGIYGACYKISILMTIFIQAYRYAAEPFFFSYADKIDSRLVYARIMNYFVIVVSAIFLIIMLFIDYVMLFVGPDFRSGQPVVPILLLANLCLGIYFNLSIWYKLTNKTGFGAIIAIIGAIITLIINFTLIPRFGYMASAWATLVCYASMMIISYFIGQYYYKINYNLKKIFFYLISALVIFAISYFLSSKDELLKLLFNGFLFLLFLIIVIFVEKPYRFLIKK